MAGGPPEFSEEIRRLSFFFDNFKNSDEAAEYVIQHDTGPGTFLLRPSTRSAGALTLTISIDNNHARHVNVQQKPDDDSATGLVFFIIPERSFSSFFDLYSYYTANAICNLEQVSNVRLLNPLNRAQQTTAAHTSHQPVTSPSTQVPLVTQDDIPPLPQKPSTISGKGPDFTKSVCSAGDVHHGSSSSQAGLPDQPSVRPSRPTSLDSQGNEHLRTSSGSSGSGIATVGATNFDMGAVGGMQDFFQEPNQPSAVPTPLSKQEQKKFKKEEKRRKKEEKKMKSRNAEMNDLVQLGWCRPPMPTPEMRSQSEEDHPYYSSPRPFKNHIEELKKMLRESEICDCGLRMLDAELVNGWTVHRSRENATFKRVFYQHEDGNTTWIFPTSITDLLSVQQVEFIVKLCKEANQDVPAQVMHRYQIIMRSAAVTQLQSPSSLSLSRSRSSTSNSFGSNDSFNRGASLDQRPPVSGPGGG